MVKYTIECEDIFTGEPTTVDLYFHLTEAELTLLDLAHNRKYTSYKQPSEKEDIVESDIILFQKLVEAAYGQKADNGMFIKDETAKKAFLCSPAYSELLKKMINGEISISSFIVGCLPKNVQSKMTVKEDGTIDIKQN